MRRLVELAKSEIRARPARSMFLIVIAILLFGIGMALGDPLGRELYLLAR